MYTRTHTHAHMDCSVCMLKVGIWLVTLISMSLQALANFSLNAASLEAYSPSLFRHSCVCVCTCVCVCLCVCVCVCVCVCDVCVCVCVCDVWSHPLRLVALCDLLLQRWNLVLDISDQSLSALSCRESCDIQRLVM